MSINFMKVHQPNLPHPDYIHKSLSKKKYVDSLVENDARIDHILDKARQLGLDKNTYVFPGPQTMAPGKMFAPTPATPPSAAPEARSVRVEAAFRRLPGVPASRPAPELRTSLAA
jgi:hypothetical protein